MQQTSLTAKNKIQIYSKLFFTSILHSGIEIWLELFHHSMEMSINRNCSIELFDCFVDLDGNIAFIKKNPKPPKTVMQT